MRLLADLHIAPATVEFLRRLGHDVVRVSDVMPATSTDAAIVAEAARQQRIILTQDLDFSAIVALARLAHPSIVTLRLSSSRIERVNAVLETVLPAVQQELLAGAVITVEDTRIRSRNLPIE
jgi:predicted nuclease of predicted toxin-antitoxin system